MNGSEWSTKKLMTCRFQRASHSPACWCSKHTSTQTSVASFHPPVVHGKRVLVQLIRSSVGVVICQETYISRRRGSGRVGSGRTGLIGVHCYFRGTVSSVNRLTHFLVSRKFWFNRLKVGQIDGREGGRERDAGWHTHPRFFLNPFTRSWKASL